jgi:hypothetical protein
MVPASCHLRATRRNRLRVPLVYFQTLALLPALDAAAIPEPLVSKSASPHRPQLLTFVSPGVPIALLALLLFGLRLLLDQVLSKSFQGSPAGCRERHQPIYQYETEVSKLPFWALVAVTLASLGACSQSVKPDQIMASVKPGMTQSEVVERLGPPDSEYQPNGLACFQYLLGGDESVPFAVYFDGDQHVTSTTRAGCQGFHR